MTAQSDNSKRIIAAQKIDKDISIVRDWLSAGHFPECVQEFAPASYELKAYWIGRRSLYLDAEDILWRIRSATGSRAQLVVPLSLRDTVFNDSHHTTVQITFIFIGQTHLVFGKRVCTCVTKHSNTFRTFLNWLTRVYSMFTWTTSNPARPQIPSPVGQTWRAAHLLSSVRARHPHSHPLKHFKVIQNQVARTRLDQFQTL